MRSTRSLRLAAFSTIAVGAAGALLCASPVANAAVYTDGSIIANGSASDNSGNCSVDTTYTGNTNVPLTENSGPVSNTYSSNVVATNGDTDDTQTANLSDTTTAELTSSGANIAAMRFSSTGSVHTTSSQPTTACAINAYVENRVQFTFTVTTPGYLNATYDQTGPSYAELYLYANGDDDANGDTYFDVESEYTKANSTHSVYLPAGVYQGVYYSEPYRSTRSAGLSEGATTSQFNATFTPDGTPAPVTPTPAPDYKGKGLQASPSIGKGIGYVSFPLARSCATGTLTQNATASKKAAKRIGKVDFYVDGVKTSTVKNVKAGQAFTVPFADTGKIRTVKTVVTTAKTKHHPHKHTYGASSTYNTCS